MATLRPDRSDSHLSPEEEARIAEEARAYFDGVTPKRHTKPQRSEYSTQYADTLGPSEGGHIQSSTGSTTWRPTRSFLFCRLSLLKNCQPILDLVFIFSEQKLICQGTEPAEEYAETEYYKDLNCVGKQHHTTGTGFIRVEQPHANPLNLAAGDGAAGHHESCRGNPATNDWIPSADLVIPTSHKPGRSDI
ncbi:unnamed protein product [Spirodela intermedia]|uniref:Uncharacterized protein n=1 Tax=Spirodela intermedia TaxID=51605 RepID=A0A7I8JIU5_SPIIN|nr:unnamed protein product [Spirodela intermedia]CAA6669443.1 unnamed protein product [Spirodela intermedia]